MSYDFFIYSPREQPVLKEDIKAELERQGWMVAFCSCGIEIEQIIPAVGPLESGTAVIACETDDDNLNDFKTLVTEGNIAALNEMIEAEDVALCGVWVSSYNLSTDYSEKDLPDLTKVRGEAYVEALRRAKTHYSFETSVFFLDFQEVVWRAIGKTAGGVLEDPQQGTVEFITLSES